MSFKDEVKNKLDNDIADANFVLIASESNVIQLGSNFSAQKVIGQMFGAMMGLVVQSEYCESAELELEEPESLRELMDRESRMPPPEPPDDEIIVH